MLKERFAAKNPRSLKFRTHVTTAGSSLTTQQPYMAIVMMFWQTYLKKAFIRVRQAISVANADLQENISGAKVIQSLSREKINFQRFDNLNWENLDANISATRRATGLQPVVELLLGAAIALVIIYSGQAIAGKLLLGSLVAFVLYVQNFFNPDS